jgi:hypothetical protein
MLNLWLLKVMLRCINHGVTNIKPGHPRTGNMRYCQMNRHSPRYSLHQEEFAFEEHPRKLQSGIPGSNGEEVLWFLWQQYRGILLALSLPFKANLLQGSKARVFGRDSPPTRSRRSAGSGGESSSMLTSVEGNTVQAFSMLLQLNLRRLLVLKANEWLITPPLKFHEWTWPTTAQLFLDCHF